jgi:hypothetical protein
MRSDEAVQIVNLKLHPDRSEVKHMQGVCIVG